MSDYLGRHVPSSHLAFPLSDRKLAGPARKQRRIGDPLPGPPPQQAYPRGTKPWLHCLPTELLAEIFSYLSTRVLLNLARCDKRLCQILTGPHGSSIWVQARQNGSLDRPIPPPLEIWPEPAYAALLFDGGHCMVCHRRTETPPRYLFWKVWVCEKPVCKRGMQREHLRLPSQAAQLGPQAFLIEDALFYDQTGNEKFYLKTQWEDAKKELEAAQTDVEAVKALLARWGKMKARKIFLASHDGLYRIWRNRYIDRRGVILTSNDNVWRSACGPAGWDQQDVSNSPTLRQCLRMCTMENDKFTHSMWDENEAAIAQEVEALRVARVDRQQERQRQARQVEVERYWLWTKSTHAYDKPVPTLKEFRSLPTIVRVEKDPVAYPKLTESLNTDRNKKALEQDLDALHLHNKKKLAKKLAFPSVQAAAGDPTPLQPCDRITALFNCIDCHKTSGPHGQAGALDYRGAVMHRCPKDKGKKREWDIRKIEPDRTATDAVRKAITAAGKDEALVTAQDMVALGARWVCLACPSELSMPFRCISGHAKRHALFRRVVEEENQSAMARSNDDTTPLMTPLPANFDLRFLKDGEEVTGTLALPVYNDTEKLMGKTLSAKRRRDEKAYGCRHCPTKSEPSKARTFTVNGVVSHIIECHGIRSTTMGKKTKPAYTFKLRDEDFYRCSAMRDQVEVDDSLT